MIELQILVKMQQRRKGVSNQRNCKKTKQDQAIAKKKRL
jgi:hypothetical protein